MWCPGCDQRHSFTVEHIDKEYMAKNHPSWPTWEWDGSLEKPTFSPSLLAYHTIHLCKDEHTYTPCTDRSFDCGHRSHGYAWRMPDGTERTFTIYEEKPEGAVEFMYGDSSPHPRDPAFGNCHSFLKEGMWQFLGDSAHHLANQTVPMVPLPAKYNE